MEPTFFQLLLLFSSSIFISFTIYVHSCRPDSCDAINGPEIRFPFRLITRQPASCGYPGFDLRCNDRNQTILDLPSSGEFAVTYIDYRSSSVYINDPGFCLPARSLNFSLSSPSSPFRDSNLTPYSLFNCSGDWMDNTSSSYYVPLFCLSGRNSTVLAVNASSEGHVPGSCRGLANISVPLHWTFTQFSWWSVDWENDFKLTWSEPACGECEERGGLCGYAADTGMTIGCSISKPGVSKGVRYEILLGIGIPGLTFLIAFVCYAMGIIKNMRHHRNGTNSYLPTTTTTVNATISAQLPTVTASRGLDPPTIESYPKTVLGESRRLPNSNNGACPICLCEYEPKETVRSIPDCEHCFHVQCIDEWLKLKGICPLCRNSPESWSKNTP